MDEVGSCIDTDAACADVFSGALQQIDTDTFHPDVCCHPFDMIGVFGNASVTGT